MIDEDAIEEISEDMSSLVMNAGSAIVSVITAFAPNEEEAYRGLEVIHNKMRDALRAHYTAGKPH